MTLRDTLEDDIHAAMRSRNQSRLEALRYLKSAIQMEEKARGKPLDQDGLLQVVVKQVNDRRESIRMFEEGNRSDLVDKESADLAVIEVYMPPQLSRDDLAELIRLVDGGTISHSVARQELFGELYRSGRPPRELIEERGLEQVGDEEALLALVREALDAHPRQLEQYRAGKSGLFGFFVGKVMRASGGKADPRKVNELVKKEIG